MSAAKIVRSKMAHFWKEHQGQSTLKEMMLDSRAEELNKDDHPEIMSYLPDYTDKRVIELGAGIGRFTSDLARKAGSVVAVDFMQEFILKNQQANGHLGNIEFLCADVTQLTREKESADLIFSNWLLMYLDTPEVTSLLTKLLSWLTPQGHLFIRESCRQPSGDYKIGQNPTQYRDPSLYSQLLSYVTIPAGDGTSVYGFDIVMSKSVDTYIKHKNNSNQVVWLVQKVLRHRAQGQGFTTFQQFLDKQQYSAKGILGYEKIFGKNFVSPGGLETTKEFVGLLNLQPGQTVLDVGGGIGGSAFYMAKEFGARVLSIDLSTNMTRIGVERAQEQGLGTQQVTFEIADVTKRDYPPQSFDVVYSRETILHIQDKKALFEKFYHWLKPGGRVLISDYCCSEGPHSDNFTQYVRQRGYHLLPPKHYGQLLERVGFVRVRAEDRSLQFIQVLERELGTTRTIRDTFIQEFSEEEYNYMVEGWKAKIARAERGEQKWGLFYAEKPC